MFLAEIGLFAPMHTAGWVVLVGLALFYGALLLLYRHWFLRLQPFVPSGAGGEEGGGILFSVVIPARNEAQNLPLLLQDLRAQSLDPAAFEVIVVDDFSTDATAQVVRDEQQGFPGLHLLQLADVLGSEKENSYKKMAIALAIERAQGQWIVTTDADCRVGPNWLALYAAYVRQNNCCFVAAPVHIAPQNNLLGLFQGLDFMTLQGITAAAVAAQFHSMCNGANLAYRKQAFVAVGGFAGIDHLASGDDLLLMHKIKQAFPGQLGYLFHAGAIVRTAPVDNWKAFWAQRIRWASKADSYADRSIFAVLLVVYFFNLLLLAGLLAAVVVPEWRVKMVGLLLFKTAVELLFLWPVAGFFQHRKALWAFPFLQPLHLVYTVVAGWLGKFGTYRWKGRVVR